MRIDPLLTNYPVRIRQVTLGVFIGISSIFYVFPRALGEAEKTAYIIKDELETFDIPQTEQIEIPEPPAKPSVPIASEDDFLDEDYDIFDTDFDDWGDWEAPPADDGGNVEFVAFDKAPKAIITIQENVEYTDIAKSMGVESAGRDFTSPFGVNTNISSLNKSTFKSLKNSSGSDSSDCSTSTNSRSQRI